MSAERENPIAAIVFGGIEQGKYGVFGSMDVYDHYSQMSDISVVFRKPLSDLPDNFLAKPEVGKIWEKYSEVVGGEIYGLPEGSFVIKLPYGVIPSEVNILNSNHPSQQ